MTGRAVGAGWGGDMAGSAGGSRGVAEISIGPLARAAQRVFTGVQVMFVLAVAVATVLAGAVVSGEVAGYATDPANMVIRALLMAALLAYAALFALMDYSGRFWRGAFWASALLIAALIVWGGLGAALFEPEGAAAADEEGTAGMAATLIALAVVLGPPVWLTARQTLAARRLLGAQAALTRDGGRTLPRAMAEARAVWRRQGRAGHGARGRWRRLGWALTALGFGGIAAVVAAVLLVFSDAGGATDGALYAAAEGVAGLGVLLLPLAALILGLGRRLSQPDAGRLLEADARAPVLLLRSFKDDAATLSSRNALKRLLYLGLYGRVRLEAAIADELARLGPFIAVGQPGETLPALGAARAYFSDDEWRDAVRDWIAKARLIVVIAGTTRWVAWELEQIQAAGKLDATVLLIPPRRGDDAETRRARLELLRGAVRA
ncbi:MAG: hypothetical protein AAFR16_07335, partial [Pseudomonadota bacterium]